MFAYGTWLAKCMVSEDVIINLSPILNRLEEKEHIEMFSVANFVW